MKTNELDRALRRTKVKNEKALIAYLAAGYPDFNEQKKLIQIMEQEGVDVLELGVPFSDPIADGPTIQFASQKSLQNGTSLDKILSFVTKLKKDVRLPIVLMSYMNPILAYGAASFAKDASKAGVSGLIVPDLIPEEAAELASVLDSSNIHMIYLIAPTTPKNRQARIAEQTAGFLYAVSVTGVTGARKKFPPETKQWLQKLRGMSPHPVCVGFGISGPDQIRQLKGGVDGFIVGSALIDIIRKNKSKARAARLRTFVRQLARECHHGR